MTQEAKQRESRVAKKPGRRQTELCHKMAQVASADGWPIISVTDAGTLELYCAVTKDRAAALAELLVEWSQT